MILTGSGWRGQFISNLKKENFDLKLNLYHYRERGTKTENELSKVRTQLRHANARTDELSQANDQLHQQLQEREHALTKAVEVIALYEDHFTDNEAMRSELLDKKPQPNGQSAAPDETAGPKCDSTFRPPGLNSVGVSPFSFRNSSPSLTTPYRAQFYRNGNVPGSPCLSVNSNLIDLNTPLSVAYGDVSLVGAAFPSGGEGHKPICLSLPPREFINRCTSVTSETPPEGEAPPSPTHSSVSALDSPQLSMLSETSFASMYRGHNDGSESFSECHNPEPSSCDERVQFMDSPVSPKKRWGQIQVQKIVGAFTPSRRVSPTRRMSPRVEIMEFKDKQDKQRGRMSRSPDMERSAMPPTPDSISPRGVGEFNSSEDDDGDDDANCCMSMVLPTGMDNLIKCTGIDEEVCGPTPRDALEASSLVRDGTGITGPRSNTQRSFKLQSGQTTTAAQKEQAFGDITNMRDTHSRLGYGFGDRLGNRNHTTSSRKHVGRDPTHGARKYISGRYANRKESVVMIPVRIIAGRELQVGTPAMAAPAADYNLSTPPYTPNSEVSTGITAVRRLARKGSWESFNSGSNSNSDRAVPRQQLIASHTAIPINPYAFRKRNNAATATATKLSMTLNKGLSQPVFNTRRPSGIPSPEVKKQNVTPALVKSNSQKVGAKERRWQ